MNCVILAGGQQKRMNGEFDKIEFCREYIPLWVKYEYAKNPGKENAGTLHLWLKENLQRREIANDSLLIVNGDVVADEKIWKVMLSPNGHENTWLISSKEMRGGFMWRVHPDNLIILLKATRQHRDKWVEYPLSLLANWRMWVTDYFVTDIDRSEDANLIPKSIAKL
jgi:choline kinase